MTAARLRFFCPIPALVGYHDGVQFDVAFSSDIGRKRQQNQDSGAAHPELGLFMVADGMGGHRGGETASAMAVETIVSVVREAERHDDWHPRELLARALSSANHAIHERSLRQPQLAGMGTTAVSLLFRDGLLTIGHVGDSRCYFFRPGALWQLTRDHSLVQEKLRAGLITRAQTKTDRMKNVITRSVGFEPEVCVDLYEMATKPGDTFLLCSDGLSGLLDDQQLLAIVQRLVFEERDLQKAAGELILGANNNGGDDNITVVLTQVLTND